MTFRQLSIFRAVHDTGSLTGAAAELSVTQPAVSMQMKELQAELGTALFQARGRRLALTEAGEELLGYAVRILALAKEAGDATRERGRSGGLVRVAASSTPGVSLLPPLIAAFRKRSPEIAVRLQVVNTQTVEQKLRAREADIGLVGGRLTSSDLVVEPWCDDELGVVVAPSHRLARRSRIDSRELAGEVLLAREHGSATRTTYEAAFLRAGVPLPQPQVVGDTEAIKSAVAAGMGVSLLSRFSVAAEVRSGALRWMRIKGVSLTRPLQLLLLPGPPRSRAVADLVEFLRSARRPPAWPLRR